jgi:DinB superfamily
MGISARRSGATNAVAARAHRGQCTCVQFEPTWVDELQDRAVRDELDRCHPERLSMRPTDVVGVLRGLDAVDAMWRPTIARARTLPPSMLHDRVKGEYSFVETLRHLVFATDAWLMRVALRASDGYHAWGMPPDLAADAPPDTGPDLEPVLEVRAGQHAVVRDHLARTSDDDLRREVAARDPTRFPQGSHRPIDCYRLVLREEWWHHRFAERDLSVVEAGI